MATRAMVTKAGVSRSGVQVAHAMGGLQERGISKQQAISLLTRSPHGDLSQYVPVGHQIATEDPEFLAHLIAWNQIKGSVRDSKVALPILELTSPWNHESFTENALAHLALLDPRNLLRAVRFSKEIRTLMGFQDTTGGAPGQGRAIMRLVERYLREREARWPWWERTALQHRASMKSLYAMHHIRPNAMADLILFKEEFPAGTVFAIVRELRTMDTTSAAAAILEHKIPFLVAQGALGAKAKEPDLVLALIERMTPAELVTNSAALGKLGVKTVPELRAAYEAAMARAADSKKVPGGAGLKASRAAAAQKDLKMADKLSGLQERQIESAKEAGEGIEGDWLVLGDKSGSMAEAIEVARHVAGTLAKLVRGQVHLVFFDTTPRYLDVTGKTYDEINRLTAAVMATGGTSIGCGLAYAMERGLSVQGIAIVSDANENTPPMFAQVYRKWFEEFGSEPPVYLYRVGGLSWYHDRDLADSMREAGHDLQEFDLRGGVDYYSIPNLVRTMRVSRYSLVDEIMETPLKTIDGVFKTL